MISPFSSFLSFTSLGMFFLFSFRVPTQSLEYSIFSFLANSGVLKKLSIHNICPWPNKGSKSSSITAAVLAVSGVIRLDCRTMFLPVYTRKHHKYPVLDSHSSKVFIHCLSELFLPLLCPQYHSSVNSWMKCTDWKHAGQIPYIDSYTKWKAELFSAYLQKELTHDICVDFKPAAGMKSIQCPSRWWGKYFKLQNAV